MSNECPYCSKVFHSGICPKVKSIEYYPNGTIKMVEFKEEYPIFPETKEEEFLDKNQMKYLKEFYTKKGY